MWKTIFLQKKRGDLKFDTELNQIAYESTKEFGKNLRIATVDNDFVIYI